MLAASCYLLAAKRSKHQRLNGSRNPGHERVRVALWLLPLALGPLATWAQGRNCAIAQGLESHIQSCLNRSAGTADPNGADPPAGAEPGSSSQLHSHNYLFVIDSLTFVRLFSQLVDSVISPCVRACDHTVILSFVVSRNFATPFLHPCPSPATGPNSQQSCYRRQL